MNEQELKASIKSKSTQALNPHLFSDPGPVGGPFPERAIDSLEEPILELKKRNRCLVEVCLIALRKGELDDDNLVGSFKPLRDLIAAQLGVDDGDKRIRWRYGQCQTRGRPETLVRMELL
jgi:hypothetical protein